VPRDQSLRAAGGGLSFCPSFSFGSDVHEQSPAREKAPCPNDSRVALPLVASLWPGVHLLVACWARLPARPLLGWVVMKGPFRFLSLFSMTCFVAAGCGGSDDAPPVNANVNPPPVNDAGQTNPCAGKDCSIAMSQLCGRAHTTLIKDGLPPDDAANAVLQAALLKNCVPVPTPASLEKGAAGAIDPTTGRPMAGKDNLLTVAGGAYVQKTVSYLDLIGATQIYLVVGPTGSWQYLSRAAGGAIIAEMPAASFSPTHDIVLIEAVADPLSGTPVLITFGQEAESTAAAASYVASEILPNRAKYDKSWYVYEWTGASGAGAAATYTLKAAGL
jgi:hypothetical protein